MIYGFKRLGIKEVRLFQILMIIQRSMDLKYVRFKYNYQAAIKSCMAKRIQFEMKLS
jgi:hypothetical protein